MKKLALSLISALLTLAMTLSCGCMSFVSEKYINGDTSDKEGTGGASTDYSVVLDSSSEMATSVTIASTEERPASPLSEQEAKLQVARTSVAIKTSGYGSGVIIDVDDGVDYGDKEDNIFYVVTCHHMISTGGEITVYVPDENYSYDNEEYTFTGTIGGAVSVSSLSVSVLSSPELSFTTVSRLSSG